MSTLGFSAWWGCPCPRGIQRRPWPAPTMAPRCRGPWGQGGLLTVMGCGDPGAPPTAHPAQSPRSVRGTGVHCPAAGCDLDHVCLRQHSGHPHPQMCATKGLQTQGPALRGVSTEGSLSRERQRELRAASRQAGAPRECQVRGHCIKRSRRPECALLPSESGELPQAAAWGSTPNHLCFCLLVFLKITKSDTNGPMMQTRFQLPQL